MSSRYQGFSRKPDVLRLIPIPINTIWSCFALQCQSPVCSFAPDLLLICTCNEVLNLASKRLRRCWSNMVSCRLQPETLTNQARLVASGRAEGQDHARTEVGFLHVNPWADWKPWERCTGYFLVKQGRSAGDTCAGSYQKQSN